MIKTIIRFSLFFLLLLVLAGAVGGFWLHHLIVQDPEGEIQPEHIQSLLGRESPVFYSDGITPLGVFFDTEHRQYVKFEDIPKDFVNALVASEDNRFFEHSGFDPESILRAMVKNIQAGRVVQGGSTLTQQTAKNLFKRSERSYEAKVQELIRALRLEHFYTKEQIFEFYANQFYVSGNGLGLGIAARYYFDKKAEDLSLVECAFIAGSVKRPNYYNPFRKKTEEGMALARERAQIRLGYVLGEMLDLGMIDQATRDEAISHPIEFKHGKVGYALDYVMELVRDAVSSDEVLDALAGHNIDNIATSGVRVVTTIDKDLQKETLFSLRRHLSNVDVNIRDYKRSAVQKELAALDYTGDSVVEPGAFLLGTIREVGAQGGKTQISVTLDKKLGVGIIDQDGLADVATGRARFNLNSRGAEAKKGDFVALLKELQPGDRVWVRVVKAPPETKKAEGETVREGELKLALARYPKIQGAAIVVRDGRIISMSGGTEDRFFNRAFYARRTMGSAFKPLVYTAAVQLGWNSADLLRNARSVFNYQGIPYFPRPDHHSPFSEVSMNWAGVKSENVASIWLLDHLCDKLNRAQFREVADQLGLTPQKESSGATESYRAYVTRMQKTIGINVGRNTLETAAYNRAVKALEADFVFDGMGAEYEQLRDLPYGVNFAALSNSLQEQIEQTSDAKKRGELFKRRDVLGQSYLQLQQGRQPLEAFQTAVSTELAHDLGFFETHQPIHGPLYKGMIDGEFYFSPKSTENMVLFDGDSLLQYLGKMSDTERRLFWDGIHVGTSGISNYAVDRVNKQFQQELAELSGRRPYDFEILENIPDFRVALGLQYVVQLGHKMGVSSDLQPVLSFPLGSNVVTPFEMTRLYETIVSGSLVTWGGRRTFAGGVDSVEDSTDSLSIIDHIESADGDLLYQPMRRALRVVDAKTSMEINSILSNVILFGTGNHAWHKVRYINPEKKLDLPVPLLGKTGTANNYTNSSFFGFVPVVDSSGKGMTLQGGYAVGVYVGFDNNDSMRHGGVYISGSNGALPAWADVASVILKKDGMVQKLDPQVLSAYGPSILWPELGQINLKVDRDTGGRVAIPATIVEDGTRAIRTFGQVNNLGRFGGTSFFKPFWSNASAQPLNRGPADIVKEENVEL
ncbi:MAG: transglycosylase domain-containing protein [Desulforhopalus sp.]|nr:transglycosylase domain-containing protein [Desulforhopalus sp.]